MTIFKNTTPTINTIAKTGNNSMKIKALTIKQININPLLMSSYPSNPVTISKPCIQTVILSQLVINKYPLPTNKAHPNNVPKNHDPLPEEYPAK